MFKLLKFCVLLSLAGCAGATVRANFVDNGGMQRAAFDLRCKSREIQLTRLDGGSLDDVVMAAGVTVGATGCGRQAAYVLAPGGFNGTWVLNSDVR